MELLVITPSEVVWTTIIASISTVLVAWISKPSKAKKERNEEEQSSNIFERVQASLSKHISELERQMEAYKQQLSTLNGKREEDVKKIKMLVRQNELCEYQHEVAKLEMMQIKILSGIPSVEVDKVYVVDDDPDVLEEFREKFNPISVLKYWGTLFIDEFVETVKRDRPSIVIMDYTLPPSTADEFLDKFGYEPEIFIMSGALVSHAKFKGKRVKFFLKESDYVFKIAIEVIKHLNEKNMNAF